MHDFWFSKIWKKKRYERNLVSVSNEVSFGGIKFSVAFLVVWIVTVRVSSLNVSLLVRDNFLSDLMIALPAHVYKRWKEVGDGDEQANQVEEAEIKGRHAAANRKVEGAGVAGDWESHQDYDHADEVLDREAER